MSEKKQRKGHYKDIEFYLSNYKELKPRMKFLDQVIDDEVKALKEKKD